MTLVYASSFIDPSAEDLASQGLAEQAQPPPYAASPFPTRLLFNHGCLTWNPVTEMGTAENAAAAALKQSEMSEEGETSVFHQLQTDSVNTECNLLFEMAGGMMMSPPRPRMNFSGEEALFLTPDFHTDMGGGMMLSTSPPRMNYFSTLSGDSIGNSDPFRLWNFADHSEVQELENRKGMMMRPNWKQQEQPCIEVDPASALKQNQSLGVWAAALEAQNMGGTVQVQPQRSDDHSVNNVDEWFQLAGGMMPSSPKYSLPSDDSHFLGGSFEPYRFWDDGAYSVGHELHNRERKVKIIATWNAVDSELFSHKEFWLNNFARAMKKGLPLVADTDDNLFWKCKCIIFSEKRIAHFDLTSPEPQHQNSLKRQLLDNLKKLAAKLAKRPVNILPAECRMMQLNSPCEGHISKSSATNEETNNVVELNNSIHAKGGNTSSQKTDRWEKDHGITHRVLQQVFGKSRDAAAKTLKVSTSTFKRACRDFGINRWPNHKGKMPYCTLNQKQTTVKKHKGIQPACSALPPLQPTNTSQCNSKMSVKVTYKNDTIRFPLSSSTSTIKYLEVQLETKFKISLENFSIKYQDEEDEWITLTCDSELLYGLDVLRSSGKTVIRMMITPKFD